VTVVLFLSGYNKNAPLVECAQHVSRPAITFKQEIKSTLEMVASIRPSSSLRFAQDYSTTAENKTQEFP
jgi:hypothetical protein